MSYVWFFEDMFILDLSLLGLIGLLCFSYSQTKENVNTNLKINKMNFSAHHNKCIFAVFAICPKINTIFETLQFYSISLPNAQGRDINLLKNAPVL